MLLFTKFVRITRAHHAEGWQTEVTTQRLSIFVCQVTVQKIKNQCSLWCHLSNIVYVRLCSLYFLCYWYEQNIRFLHHCTSCLKQHI